MKHLYEIYSVERTVRGRVITVKVELCSQLTGEIFTGVRHARCSSKDQFDLRLGTKIATERALKQALEKFAKDVHKQCATIVKELNETYHYLEKIEKRLHPDGNYEIELDYEAR